MSIDQRGKRVIFFQWIKDWSFSDGKNRSWKKL